MNIQRARIKSQQGIISILTTTVMMVVISLIVLGLSQVVNRNQRNTLDQQLSTQAFYAAESGINDVLKVINDQLSANPNAKVTPKSDCTTSVPFYNGLNPDLNLPKNVKYTCVLVNPTPTVLRYGTVSTTSTIIPITPVDGSGNSVAVGTLKLEWKAKNNTTPSNNCPFKTTDIPNSSSWTCGYGLLRVDIVPTAGVLTVDGLRNNTRTVFAFPFASGGSVNVSSSRVQGVTCN